MSMQTKILAAVTKAATDAGLEVVNQGQWANTGTLYVQPVDSFEVLLRVGYNFQDTNATLWLLPATVDEAARAVAPKVVRFAPAGQMCGASCPRDAVTADAFWAPISYANGDDVQSVVDFVATLVATAPAHAG